MKENLDFGMLPLLGKSIYIYYKTFLSTINHLGITAEMYLFDSISKGKYNSRSDIDFLILLDKPIDKSTKIDLWDALDDACLDNRLIDLDVKFYTRERFFSTDNFFENSIQKDLIPVKNIFRRCKYNYDENNV